MAAKLCLRCGGSGKVVVTYRGYNNYMDVFADVPILLECPKCNGNGYIPIPKK
jgi:DnaJ-class molecular chaperone